MLTKAHLMPQKADIISGITAGRTASSREMNVDEAQAMITYLKSVPVQAPKPPDAGDKMRKKLISLAYELHWAAPGDWKQAVAALDAFLTGPKSIFKKPLNKHTPAELVKVVSQMEKIYEKWLKAV